MKKIYLFIIIDILLVLVNGLALGIGCSSIVFVNSVTTTAFVVYLISLVLPLIIYLVKDKLCDFANIFSILLIVSELAINLSFIFHPNLSMQAFAITQACVISAYLIALLVLVGINYKQGSNNE